MNLGELVPFVPCVPSFFIVQGGTYKGAEPRQVGLDNLILNIYCMEQ
jgi:hypothetical protein